jgi:hypothetical protein
MRKLFLALLVGTNALIQGGQAQVPTQEQCQQADAQLNQVYQQLRGTLNDAQKQQLKQAQRDWIKKRDAFVAANPGNPQGALYQATMQRVTALQGVLQKIRGYQAGETTRNPEYTKTEITETNKTESIEQKLRVEFSDDASGYASLSEKAGLLATSKGDIITLWDLKTGYLLLKKKFSFLIKGIHFNQSGNGLEVLWTNDLRYGDLNLSEISLKDLDIIGDSKKLDIRRGALFDYIISSDSKKIISVACGGNDSDLSLYVKSEDIHQNVISLKGKISIKGSWVPGGFYDQNIFTLYQPDGKQKILSVNDIIKNQTTENKPKEIHELEVSRASDDSTQCDDIANKLNNEMLRLDGQTAESHFLARDENLFFWNIRNNADNKKIISNINNGEKTLLKDLQSLPGNTPEDTSQSVRHTLVCNFMNLIGENIYLQSETRVMRPDQKISDVKPSIRNYAVNLQSFSVNETPIIINPRREDRVSEQNNGMLKISSDNITLDIPNPLQGICPFPEISFSPDHKHFLVFGSGRLNHAAPVECFDLNNLSNKTQASLIHEDNSLTSSVVSLLFYPFVIFLKPDNITAKRFGSDDILCKWGTDALPGYAEHVTFAIDLNQRRIAVLGGGNTDEPDRLHLLELSKDGILKEICIIKFSKKSLLTLTPDYFYAFRGSAIKDIHFVKGFQPFPLEQFDLRLNRPDIVLERLGAPKEAVETAKSLRDKRLKRMGVTEEMLKPDFHLPELQIVGEVPASTPRDQLDLQIKATDDKYPLDRLRVYVNNVPVNGRDGELLRDQKTQSLEKTIPIKLAAGRNKIQVSVLNSAGAESLYANAEVTCTADRPKPKLYAVSLGVSQYDRPEWCLKYAAKDATDLIDKLKAKAGSSYSEVKPLLLTDKEVTKESISKIKEFLSGTTIDDTVLIFMAGHGLLDDKYDYYFGTADIDPARPSDRGMPYEAIDNILAEVPSLKKALLMDTCHAGELDDDEKKDLAASDGSATPAAIPATDTNSSPMAGKVAMRSIGTRGMTVKAVEGAKGKSDWYEKLQDMFVDLRRGSGATVISSSQGAEYAFESSEQSNGIFTYALMEALDGKATPNKDGQITISAIGDYVKKRVQDLTKGKQNPNLRGVNLEEDFTLSSTK